jgi:hypothetical protein
VGDDCRQQPRDEASRTEWPQIILLYFWRIWHLFFDILEGIAIGSENELHMWQMPILLLVLCAMCKCVMFQTFRRFMLLPLSGSR